MKSPDLTVSGALLRRARELAGHTQEALAELVGVERPTVANWESPDPKRQPGAANFKKLCEVLGRQPEELLVSRDDQAA